MNKVCGSALKAVVLAAQAIWLEEKSVIVAGGMESMSQAPHLLWGAREGVKFGDLKMKDSMIDDGLWCAFDDQHMGKTGEVIALGSPIIALQVANRLPEQCEEKKRKPYFDEFICIVI